MVHGSPRGSRNKGGGLRNPSGKNLHLLQN